MPALFEELHIASLTARNRIVRAATAESLATPEGRPTERLVELYRRLAQGGVGTIVTGDAYVMPDGKPSEGARGIYGDSFSEEYRVLADVVHAAGARIVMQLVYGGSKSKVPTDDSRRLAPVAGSVVDGVPTVAILGPSSLENPKTHLVPIEASADDLDCVVRAFGAAAARAQAYGFDGVEVHVAHGYLLSQFLSGRFNVREDEYGGTLENRARLAVDCVRSVREAVGKGYPVLAKVNSCDNRNDPRGERSGLSEYESEQVAVWLCDAGVDAIEVSGDWHGATADAEDGEPFFAEFGARLANAIAAPVIVTGGWRRLDSAEKHLDADGIAAIGMSRALICEPDLPLRWQRGDSASSACTGCGYCLVHPGIPCKLTQSKE